MTTLIVTSPFDQSEVGTVPTTSQPQAESLLQKAKQTYDNRDGWLEHYERTAILNRLAKLVEDEADDFALLIAKEGGKPLTDAKIEVSRAIDGIYLAAKELMHVMCGKEIPMGHTPPSINRIAFTTYEPIGVVLAISAFNHPLNLIVHQVVPAIAVGCPVIVKPASSTPLCCFRFVELVRQAGLPKDWCQACACDVPTIKMLASDSRLGFVSFIGSAQVGWALKKSLAPGVRCALEHGGVAPVIVDEDVDIEHIIPMLLKGGFYHAGQVCVSVQRIYAHESIAKQLADKLAAGAKQLIVGDPTKPDTQVGPLISPKEVDRAQAWVKEAIDAGATCLSGGKRITNSTFEPTVLFNPPSNAKVSTQEAFAPVVSVFSYSSRLEAIRCANSLEVSFQAAVFTKNIDVAFDTAKRLNASAVMINDHTAFRVDWMPFAGHQQSGYGIGGIGYSMHEMIKAKMLMIKENR